MTKYKDILDEECEVRWKERSMSIYCGHPQPCPKHTNRDEWILSKISQVLQERDNAWTEALGEMEVSPLLTKEKDKSLDKMSLWFTSKIVKGSRNKLRKEVLTKMDINR